MRRRRRKPTARIVRRKDALGRTYFVEKKTGHRASRRSWTLDRERRAESMPREPSPPRERPPELKPPRRPEPFPSKTKKPAFPPGVKAPGVPEAIDLDEVDWDKQAVEGRRDYR